MFIPGSLGMFLPLAPLDPVDENLWPKDVPAPSGETWVYFDAVGMNFGTLFVTQTIGYIHQIGYYRGNTLSAASGRMSLWRISDFTDELLVDIPFSGHAGTGWRMLDIDPIKVIPTDGYVVALWVPSVPITENVPIWYHYGYWASRGHYSQPNAFLYGMWSNSQEDPRGFYRLNGFRTPGVFARPDDTDVQANFWLDVTINARPKPIPPLPPMILKWPIPAGWPSPDNTGPDPDTVYTTELEGYRSTSDGQVIEDLEIFGMLVIEHNNVTVQNCKVHNAYPFVVYIINGTTGTIIQDCELDGIGRQNGNVCGVAVGGTNCQILRNNIYRIENGIALLFDIGPLLVKDNCIHHLFVTPGGAHYDCWQMDGGMSDVVIEHNTMMCENGWTSAIMIDTENGDIDNVLITDNYLCGGGFTCYTVNFTTPGSGVVSNIRYVRNLLQMGKYGYFRTEPAVEFYGNQYLTHGSIFITPPPGGFTDGQLVPEDFFGIPFDVPAHTVVEAVSPEIGGLNLGMSFTVAKNGQITGVNYMRPTIASTAEVRVGLWQGAALIASKTFTDIVTEVSVKFYEFDTPVPVVAGNTYTIGVWVPRGPDGNVYYFAQNGYFWPDPVSSQWGSMTAFANNGTPGHNGLFFYGPELTRPVSWTSNDSNYYVDPVFVAPWSGVPVVLDPVLLLIEPSTASVGAPDFTMVVTGTNFTPVSKVWFAGVELATTYSSPTKLICTVPSSGVIGIGPVPVQVKTGLLVSNVFPFTFMSILQVAGEQTTLAAASTGAIGNSRIVTADQTMLAADSVGTIRVDRHVIGSQSTLAATSAAAARADVKVTGTQAMRAVVNASQVYIGRRVTGAQTLSAATSTGSISLALPETFFAGAVPTGSATVDNAAIVLGARIDPQVAGSLRSVSFYRSNAAASSTGWVYLWRQNGSVLLQARQYDGITGTGWKTIPFKVRNALDPAASYVITYWQPTVGGSVYYQSEANVFTAAQIASSGGNVVMVKSDGVSDRGFPRRNGLFVENANPVFPTSTFNGTNYFVDAEFVTGTYPAVPDLSSYPRAGTTGHRGTLTAMGSYTTVANGELIQNKDISGRLFIRHNNVTVRNCRIRDNGATGVIYCDWGHNGLIVEDCTIDGMNNSNGVKGINLNDNNNAIVRRCNIFGSEDGINWQGDGQQIIDNYIHDLMATANPSPHKDGISSDGDCSNTIIRHNTVLGDITLVCTIQVANQTGPCTNILIEDNLVGGGGYQIMFDARFTSLALTGTIKDNVHLMNMQYDIYRMEDANPPITGATKLITVPYSVFNT